MPSSASAFPRAHTHPVGLIGSDKRYSPILSNRNMRYAALACWLGFVVVALALASGHLQNIDRAGLLIWRHANLQPLGSANLSESARDLTALGGGLMRILVTIGALVALLFQHRKGTALVFTATIASGWLAEMLMKHVVARPRPQIVPHLMHAGGTSFPSGHSFVSALLYITIALTFGAASTRKSVHTALLAAAIGVSMAIAWSRLWLGVHWPSDVTCGWLAGAGWAFTAAALTYPRGE